MNLRPAWSMWQVPLRSCLKEEEKEVEEEEKEGRRGEEEKK